MDHNDRRAAAAADPSAAKRDSLFLSANLRVAGDTAVRPIRVRNLSAGGLMAELADPVDPEVSVEVEVRGLGWVKGRIAWHTEGRAGIAFDRPVDPQRARKPVGARTESSSGRPLSISLP